MTTPAPHRSSRHGSPRGIWLGLVLLVAVAASGASTPSQQAASAMSWRAPRPLVLEHAEIHCELARAADLPGATGEAARHLAALLTAHFRKEERDVFPALGLLQVLARDETPERMRDILPLTERLRAELPVLLDEDRDIARAVEELKRMAWAESRPRYAFLADQILRHAWRDEEVTYPAALLVGRYVRERLRTSTTP
ncbi:MAG: hypothetical protein GEV06_26440 [Luteitalea sp.]|nr:hypothetical protein [Luteitalea sp.]